MHIPITQITLTLTRFLQIQNALRNTHATHIMEFKNVSIPEDDLPHILQRWATQFVFDIATFHRRDWLRCPKRTVILSGWTAVALATSDAFMSTLVPRIKQISLEVTPKRSIWNTVESPIDVEKVIEQRGIEHIVSRFEEVSSIISINSMKRKQ